MIRAWGSSSRIFMRHVLNRQDAVVEKEKPAPPELISRWIASRIVRSSYCVTIVSTGQPVVRRGLNGAHIPRAGQGEVKGCVGSAWR